MKSESLNLQSSNRESHCTLDAEAVSDLEQHIRFVRSLVEKGGPAPEDYAEFDNWLKRVQSEIEDGRITVDQIHSIWRSLGEDYLRETMQGFALIKPHGYAGDFEFIDRIYQNHTSPIAHLSNWDRYCHLQPAPRAVRNRKTYFHQLLDRHSARKKPMRILNLGSGPGRCIFEWLAANSEAKVSFFCVETDPEAIDYAQRLNHRFLDRISFIKKNLVRYKPSGHFDLIWAAGIFDYFASPLFESVLRRLLSAIGTGGELVIGNFSPNNRSRAYMELVGDWRLQYRSAKELTTIAVNCGIPPERIYIGAEPEGVNLFLHIVST